MSKAPPTSANLIPVGCSAWIPASCTQLFYHIPKEIQLHSDAKLSYLPVTVKSYDPDGKTGFYILDWDDKVVLKCQQDYALPRSPKNLQQMLIGSNSNDISHLDFAHDASIVWELMINYSNQNYYSKVGSSSSIIVLNPLESDTRLFSQPTIDSNQKLNVIRSKGRRNSVLKSSESSRKSSFTAKEGHSYSSLIEDLHVFCSKIYQAFRALDDKATYAIMMQGCSGSGKSEAIKYISQYFMQKYCSNSPSVELDLNPKSLSYISLGSSKSPFAFPCDNKLTKSVALGMRVLDLFTHAPNNRGKNSSRHIKRVSFIVDKSHHLSSVNYDVTYIDLRRICHVDEINRPYLIVSTFAAFLLKDLSQQNKCKLSESEISMFVLPEDVDANYEEFKYFKSLLMEMKFNERILTQIFKTLEACMLLSLVKFYGVDIANLSEESSDLIKRAEEALELSPGSLATIFLYKEEDRASSLKGSTVERRPNEATNARDLFCNEIYSRAIRYLLEFCSTTNQSTVNYQSNELNYKTIHLIDPPGWEILLNSESANGLTQLNINYIFEKSTSCYINSCFASHMKKYSDNPEEISGIKSNSISGNSISESIPYVDLFERPSTGLISILEEISISIRGDDKIFTDKVLSIHARNKQIRSTGHKASITSFIVRHTFGDVTYDAIGFVIQNKSKVTAQEISVIASIPYDFILSPTSDDESMFTLEELLQTDEAINDIHRAELKPNFDKIGKPPRKSSSLDKNAPKYVFHMSKCREGMNQLCSLIETATSSSFVICLRPSASMQGYFDPDFVSSQVKALYLTPLAQLMKSGYSLCKPYAEFYSFLRTTISPFHRLPLSIPQSSFSKANTSESSTAAAAGALLPTLSITSDASPVVKAFCRSLLLECMSLAGISMNIYDSGNPNILFKEDHLILFSKHYVCLKERAAQILVATKTKYETKMNQIVSKIQSYFRMRTKRRHFRLIILRSVIMIQAYIRRHLSKKHYRYQTAMIARLQRNCRMIVKKLRYQRILNAVKVIKNRIFHKLIHKLRYVRMQRAVRLLHHLCRGYLYRYQTLVTVKAVDVLRSALKGYIRRLRLYRKKQVLSIIIQRIVRGHLTRIKQSHTVRILELRRKQRIAQKVTIQIQSLFRKRLVNRKYLLLKKSTRFLQYWIRSRFIRKRYVSMKYVAIWLQKNWRRMQAIHLVSNIRMAAMVLLEETKVWKFKCQELNLLQRIANDVQDEWQIGNVTHRNGKTKCTRRIIGFDAHFDLSEVYPYQWMKSVIEFSDNLKRDEKKTLVDMAIGGEHTILLDNSSNFYSFGSGDSGQLGHNNRQSLAKPTLMETMQITVHSSEASFHSLQGLKQATIIVSICCGRAHTLILASSGKMYSWGSNKRGQLGHSHFEACAIPRMVGQDLIESAFNKNAPKNAIISRNVKQISSGAYHCACIADPGYLYTWGAGSCLGRVQSIGDLNKIKGNMLNAKGAKITMTGRKDADITCPDSSEPTVPPFFSKKRVQNVICGDAHVISRSNTEFYSWGRNAQGQLGIGDFADTLMPSPVKLPSFKEAEAATAVLSSGGRHMALLVNGKIWCWGWNCSGQIGNGTTENVSSPMLITVPGTSDKGITVKQIVTGWQYTAAVTSMGTPYLWGSMNVWGEQYPTTFLEATDNGTLLRLTPQAIDIPQSQFGQTFGLVSMSNSTMSVLAVDSEDFSSGRSFPLPFTNTLSLTPSLASPHHANNEDNDLKLAKVRNEDKLSVSKTLTKSESHDLKRPKEVPSSAPIPPYRMTVSANDVSERLLRLEKNGPVISALLREKMKNWNSQKQRRSSIQSHQSSMRVDYEDSDQDDKSANHSDTRQSNRLGATEKNQLKEIKLHETSITEYFSLRRREKSNAEKSSDTNFSSNVFSVLSSLNPDLALTPEEREEFDRLRNSSRGINMPSTERNILLKFTSQRKELQAKHLNELLPRSSGNNSIQYQRNDVDKLIATSKFDVSNPSISPNRRLSRRLVTDVSLPPKLSVVSPVGIKSATEASRPFGISTEGVRSLNNAIDSLRLDIRQLETQGPRGRKNSSSNSAYPSKASPSKESMTRTKKDDSSMGTNLSQNSRLSRSTQPSILKTISPRKKSVKTIESNIPKGSDEAKDMLEVSDVRDFAVLLQSIKRENIQKIADSWKY